MSTDILGLYENMDLSSLYQFLENKQEENLFLDFKEKRDCSNPKPSTDDKKNLAKTLSAFSNASGGLLIWGVCAKKNSGEEFAPDVVQSLEPINNVTTFLTNLNTLCSQALDPPNPGIQNKKIIQTESVDTGFVVTYVPPADTPPCMALLSENRYYIRINDTSQSMQHYMLSDMFGRRPKPKLEIHYKVTSGTRSGNQHLCTIHIGIRNIGKYIARFPGVRIKGSRLGGESPHGYADHYWGVTRVVLVGSSPLNEGFIWTGGANDVIHPYITMDVMKIERMVTKDLLVQEGGLIFNYELYAEGCSPVSGTVQLPHDELLNALGLY